MQDVLSQLRTYTPDAAFSRSVVYLSMEFAIDQSLKTYSGGLGFLAGSHMRSAYDLKQNIIGIGLLWKYGYYDQVRAEDASLEISFVEKNYSFLIDTGIVFTVPVHNHDVYVKAYLLSPETFHSAPVFFLSTDLEQNDYLSRAITHKLYDENELARIAQSIILGEGALKLMEALKLNPEKYHLNESHALPLVFGLYRRSGNWDEVKRKTVFTTHTPEVAGNELRTFDILEKMSFFNNVSVEEVKNKTAQTEEKLNYAEAALCLCGIANGVSQLHTKTCHEMYEKLEGISPIISITNAQNKRYWMDMDFQQALHENNDDRIRWRKKHFKRELFKVVADHTGKIFDPDILTIVWARRFAAYKRADLLLKDYNRFMNLVQRQSEPVQVIWAGKPYPYSGSDIGMFNDIFYKTKYLKRCAVLTGYELALSAMLKKGSDIWLNTPRYPREASGTSGMTAAMNASLNFSIDDGWMPEFSRHKENCFIIPHAEVTLPEDEKDEKDYQQMMSLLENEIIPMYYTNQVHWIWMIKNAMTEVTPRFDSDRMAREYYEKLYHYQV